jgi:hypothetical protein
VANPRWVKVYGTSEWRHWLKRRNIQRSRERVESKRLGLDPRVLIGGDNFSYVGKQVPK